MKMWQIAIVLLALLMAGCGGTQADQDSGSQENPRSSASETPDLPVVTIDSSGGKKVDVRVEIADGPFERARGLMDRSALGKDRGMLFIFGRDQRLSFWMKDTLIPLSIAYIDSRGHITDILDMKPLDDKPPHYTSSEPVRYALEVNKGFFDERDVEVGDRVQLPD